MPHPIARPLYAVSAITGDHFFRVFDDWLGLATAALSSDADKKSRYMEIMGRYGERKPGRDHPANHFAKALAEFFRTCRSHDIARGPIPDVLGAIYEAESLTNSYKGQFFTPEPVCRMMARMMIEPTQEPISIADPACGSGRFFIAAQPLAPKAKFYGTDTDLTCVRMCSLNMLVRNADAAIVHGNTLSLEVQGGFVVKSSVFGGTMATISADMARSILVATAAQAAEPAAGTTEPSSTPQPERPAGSHPFVTTRKGQFDFGF